MFFGSQLNLYVVCVIVILGRIVDMSLATIRTVFTVRNRPEIAAPIGFIEAFFWFMIVKAALAYAITNPILETFVLACAYSLGFALGTFVGGKLSRKFVKSKIHVQIVLNSKYEEIVAHLREKGFGQTIIPVKGSKHEEKYMIFVETDSGKFKELKEAIHSLDEKAFISVIENKSTHNGFFGAIRK